MKKFIPVLISILLTTSSFAKTEFSRIKERNSNRSIIYYKDGSELSFSVSDGQSETEIKRLTYDVTEEAVTIYGDKDPYTFNFLKKSVGASADAYRFCWSSNEEIDILGMSTPATIGVAFFIVGIFGSMALCAALPAVPTIIGVVTTPIDGAITLADHLLDSDEIASRKFQKVMKGKSVKASKKVFASLIRQIKAL